MEPRIQTPPSTMTPTTPEVPTTTCCPLTRPGVVRRIPGRRHAPRSICIPVCASHLMATCLTYVCTQILLLPLARLLSSPCIRALEAPGLYYDACMTYFHL